MVKICRSFYISLLISLFTSSAFAQTDNPNVHNGFYFGAAAGTGGPAIDAISYPNDSVNYQGNAYQFNAGYLWKLSDKALLGFEIDYNGFSKGTQSSTVAIPRIQYLIPLLIVTTTTQTDSVATASSTALMMNVMVYPLPKVENLFLFGKLGLAIMAQHFTQTGTKTVNTPSSPVWGPGGTTVTPISVNQKTNRLTLVGDIGLGYDLTSNVALTVEVQQNSVPNTRTTNNTFSTQAILGGLLVKF